MKSPRKAKLADHGRLASFDHDECRLPAPATAAPAPTDPNTCIYIGETSGPNPTKYFFTVCFDRSSP